MDLTTTLVMVAGVSAGLSGFINIVQGHWFNATFKISIALLCFYAVRDDWLNSEALNAHFFAAEQAMGKL